MTAPDYRKQVEKASLKKPTGDELLAVVPPKARDQVIAELNEEYALLLVGDRPVVLWERPSLDGGPDFQVLSVAGFHEWLRPRGLFINDRRVAVSKLWLNDERRRQYDGICFAPGEETPPRFYNLWKGFALEPSLEGSCARFLDHVAMNVCDGDESLFAWVMGWFAHLVQHPREKLGTALVLRGAQGTGKTIVGKTVGSLLGQHYTMVDDERFITGRFNSHLASCLLLQLEEATWGGDHAAAGKLKHLVTGDYQLIEYKGKEPIRVKNFVRLLITSNSDWVVPAGLEERRFAVLDVTEGRKQDHRYFQAIEDELRAGGRAALLHYLLTYDLTDIPLRQIPGTAALYEQKLAGLSPELAWWMDILMTGELPGDRAGEGQSRVQDLYTSYVEHAQKRGVVRRGAETQLGFFLKKYAPEVRRARTVMLLDGSTKRPYVYEFPALKRCRQAFAERMQTAIEWPDPDANWGGSS